MPFLQEGPPTQTSASLRPARRRGLRCQSFDLNRQNLAPGKHQDRISRSHSESSSQSLLRRSFPLLETCPCDLLNFFLRLVRKHSPEEDQIQGFVSRRQAAVPYQQSNLRGNRKLSQPGSGVQGWQVTERGTQTRGCGWVEIELAGSIRTRKVSCAVCRVTVWMVGFIMTFSYTCVIH